MEFNKLKGFWKSSSTTKSNDVIVTQQTKKPLNANENGNNNKKQMKPNKYQEIVLNQLEALEEIKPEVTSEGYGLRTPYGTHLNLDFVKYCEDLITGQEFKRTSSMRLSRSRAASTTAPTNGGSNFNRYSRNRMTSGASQESLEMDENAGVRVDTTLTETRRRLEAFRSFRTKRHKSSPTDHSLHPPMSKMNATNNGYNSHSHNNVPRRGSSSPSGSISSGSMTPNSLGGALSPNNITPQHLQVVREQMAAALGRLRELEEQVKTIPVLQVKLSVLQQEKRHLCQELQRTRERDETSKRLSSTTDSNTSLETSALPSPTRSLRSSSSSGVSSNPGSPIRFPSKSSAPPLPPKRKYRSVGVGDPHSVWDVVCTLKKDLRDTATSCDVRTSICDVTTGVEPSEIDAAFDIFPSPPKQFQDQSCTADLRLQSANVTSQTPNATRAECVTQTEGMATRSICVGGDSNFMTYDKATSTPPPVRKTKSTETDNDVTATADRSTMTSDLTFFHDAGVGNHVMLIETGTSPSVREERSVATDSCDLVATESVACGTFSPPSRDASSATDFVATGDASVDCKLLTPVVEKILVSRDTMTAGDQGRWCSYAEMTSRSCGSDNDVFGVSKFEASTNTVSVRTLNQAVETDRREFASKLVSADVRPVTSDQQTHTDTVSQCDRQTRTDSVSTCDVSTDAATESRDFSLQVSNNDLSNSVHVSTVTCLSTTDSSTMTSPTLVVTSDASTDMSEFESSCEEPKAKNNEEIDTYVNRVQTLLEEQQDLLAENFEVFTEEWRGEPTDKISRFVNPAFMANDPQDDVSSGGAIAASLSIPNVDYDVTDSESSSDEAMEHDGAFFPLSNPDDFELRSILKKPDTPLREKKFLRFAEGVKSDDSSSDDTDEYSSSDEDEKIDQSHIDGKVEAKEVAIETKHISPRLSDSVFIEEKECPKKLNYSNEFVRKISDEEKESKKECIEEKKEEKGTVIGERLVGDGAEQMAIVIENTFNKYVFTTEVLDACDILEKHLRNPKSVNKRDVISASALVQKEWFKVAAQSDSSIGMLDDFVSDLADTSLPVLRKVVNMTDASGNTVLHYAISHGNIPVIETLVGIDELDVNKSNQAGYTASMLAALCEVKTEAESRIFKHVFLKSNVNAHAKEAGQTALMLAVSHGRVHTAKLLLESGAEVNARDEDGSTALMCAVEHGQLEIVKLLLTNPTCDPALADTDGSTALTIAMEADHRDIAILLYAQQNFKPASKIPRPRIASKSMIPSPTLKCLKS